MADIDKKNDSPTCACGKVDLYEEFLKNKSKEGENDENDENEPTGSDKSDSQ